MREEEDVPLFSLRTVLFAAAGYMLTAYLTTPPGSTLPNSSFSCSFGMVLGVLLDLLLSWLLWIRKQ